MPSGGHARSGPPRDPYALRRPGTPAENGWIQLTVPTEPAPAWPLADPANPAEEAVWRDLWSRPQATVWPRLNLVREVAVYTRCLAEFEAPGKTNAALGNLIRKQADDLGLSVVGADRNKWLMPKADASAAPATVTPIRRGAASRPSARERFTVTCPPATREDADHDHA